MEAVLFIKGKRRKEKKRTLFTQSMLYEPDVGAEMEAISNYTFLSEKTYLSPFGNSKPPRGRFRLFWHCFVSSVSSSMVIIEFR
jgi:hypothetical protein